MTPEPDIAALRAEVERLRNHIQLHAGDTLSLSNEVDQFRDMGHEEEKLRIEAYATIAALKAGLARLTAERDFEQSSRLTSEAQLGTIISNLTTEKRNAERQRDESVKALKRISKLSQDETDPQQTIHEDSSSGNYYDDVWAGARLAYYECADIARATLTKLQSSREEGGEG